MGRDARFNLRSRQILGADGLTIDPYQVVIDRFGRQISLGDVILHTPKEPIAATILHMQPALDPNVPAGHVRIIFSAQFNVLVPKGIPINDLVLITPATEEEVATLRRRLANHTEQPQSGLIIPGGSPDSPSMTDSPDAAPPAPEPKEDDDAAKGD